MNISSNPRTDLIAIGELKGLKGDTLTQWVEGMLDQGAVQSEAIINDRGIPVDNRNVRPVEGARAPFLPQKER